MPLVITRRQTHRLFIAALAGLAPAAPAPFILEIPSSLFPDAPLPALGNYRSRSAVDTEDDAERYEACDCCGAEHNPDDLIDTVSDDRICSDCSVSCEECGAVHDTSSEEIGSAYTGDGYSRRNRSSSILCDECAENCADCGDRYATNSLSYSNASDESICGACAENYSTCEGCNSTFHQDDLSYHERSEASYCSRCMPSESENIESHDYKPRAEFFYGATERREKLGKMFFGAELEIESHDGDKSDDAEMMNDTGEYYCKEDGSIDDGFEIVSHPATILAWRERSLKEFNKLRKRRYTSYDSNTCGMHVHVSRKALSGLDQLKLLAFFRDNAKFVTWISRRKNISEWSEIEHKTDREFASRANGKTYSSDRYVAINMMNDATIEFRIFRGTLSVPAFRRNLEFVNAICQFVKCAGLRELTYTHFARWIAGAGKGIIGKYPADELLNWFAKYDKGSSALVRELASAAE